MMDETAFLSETEAVSGNDKAAWRGIKNPIIYKILSIMMRTKEK
jgi:hypothetical protein